MLLSFAAKATEVLCFQDYDWYTLHSDFIIITNFLFVFMVYNNGQFLHLHITLKF